jgi:hypothetical protein
VSKSPFRRIIDAPDFWRLWWVGLIVATVRWLETVAVGVVVYQRTESAFLVAMMTMLRLLPMGSEYFSARSRNAWTAAECSSSSCF